MSTWKLEVQSLNRWFRIRLDLIEFANGDESSEWGKVRAQLGHKHRLDLNILELEMSSGRWIIQISLHAIRFLNSVSMQSIQR